MANKTTKKSEEKETKHERITPEDFNASDAVDEALENDSEEVKEATTEEPTDTPAEDLDELDEDLDDEEDDEEEEEDEEPAPAPVKKSQKAKTREKIRNRTRISDAEARANHLSKARRMKEILAAQPQVSWFIPLAPGESENSVETVILNGHMEMYPKGKAITVPLQVMQVLAAAYGIDTSETEQRFNIAKNPRLQEPLG